MSAPYHRALVDAAIIAPSAYPGGITVWRSRGLQVVSAMVDTFRAEVSAFAEPVVLEHNFLQPVADYRRVFPAYANVLTAGDVMMRADNLHRNVAEAQVIGRSPILSVNGLVRTLCGGAMPLFRERHIWPAIQLNDIVPSADATDRLGRYALALERTFAHLGLPAVTIETGPIGDYGKSTYLTVSCLPDGRPTVVATAYIMADAYRRALGVADEVIDIGFTGKVVALVAMHHRDRFGLQLPARLAPVQVGVIDDGTPIIGWLDSLRAAGLRVEVVNMPRNRGHHRQRAERRYLRHGVPIVVGVHDNPAVVLVATRCPLVRRSVDRLPPAKLLMDWLESYEQRQAARAERALHVGLRRTGLLRGICASCSGCSAIPIYGWTRPSSPTPCLTCGQAGEQALVSESARFY